MCVGRVNDLQAYGDEADKNIKDLNTKLVDEAAKPQYNLLTIVPISIVIGLIAGFLIHK